MARAAMSTDAAIDLLRRLALAAHTGQPVPADVAGWLLDGAARYFGGECHLDDALGLRGPGIRSPARLAKQVRRDAELQTAFRLADGASAWRRAEVLAHAVRRTARGRRLPAGQQALEAAIARARSHGLELPESARRLLDICVGASGA